MQHACIINQSPITQNSKEIYIYLSVSVWDPLSALKQKHRTNRRKLHVNTRHIVKKPREPTHFPSFNCFSISFYFSLPFSNHKTRENSLILTVNHV